MRYISTNVKIIIFSPEVQSIFISFTLYSSKTPIPTRELKIYNKNIQIVLLFNIFITILAFLVKKQYWIPSLTFFFFLLLKPITNDICKNKQLHFHTKTEYKMGPDHPKQRTILSKSGQSYCLLQLYREGLCTNYLLIYFSSHASYSDSH